MPAETDAAPTMVRIPADVGREDKILGPLTARQVLILGLTGLVLYGLFQATRHLLPAAVFLAVAVPVAAAAAVIALGRRDGVGLDRLVAATVRQRRAPSRMVPAPTGIRPAPAIIEVEVAAQAAPLPAVLHTPVREVTGEDGRVGVVDLGPDGFAVVCACSTVNFLLRTGWEQQALIAAFARFVNSVSTTAQLLVRARPVDLLPAAQAIAEAAPGLPHPALEAAAVDHAHFLAGLGEQETLLTRQVLLVLREAPTVAAAGGAVGRRRRSEVMTRLARQAEQAVRALAAADITVTVLDPGQVRAVLAGAFDPATHPAAGAVAAEEPIRVREPDPTPPWASWPDPSWTEPAPGEAEEPADAQGGVTWFDAE